MIHLRRIAGLKAAWICCLVLCALTTSFRPTATAAAGDTRPNVVFILTDDLGINDLGCYGRSEHSTPHLNRLAAEGIRFTSAYCAQPICSASRAALMTGKTPARLRLTTYLPGRPDCASQPLLQAPMQKQLPLEETTLPEYLHRAGYVTGCFGKWHLGDQGFGPLEQGFDVYQPAPGSTAPSEQEGSHGEHALTSLAEQFLEQYGHRRFFLFLSHTSPHIPFAATPGRQAKFARSFEPAYAAMIETLDDAVGRLLAKLDKLGLRERTLIVFTSDNGGLHVPELAHARVTHNTPFRAGKGYLYEGGLRIPLIVRWPGQVPAGRVVDQAVVNTDWLPSLLEITGTTPPPGLDGVSMLPLLLGRERVKSRPLFWHFPHYTNQGGQPAGAMREGDWKLIEHYENERLELFNLENDPCETRDLSSREARRVRRMQTALHRWRATVRAQLNQPNPNFDPARYQPLYVEFIPSLFDPGFATTNDWQRAAEWRRAMDTAVTKPRS